jgi:type VI secretion system protein VasD
MRRREIVSTPFSPVRRALLLAGGGLACGCASSPPAPEPVEPVTLAVSLIALPDVNPDTRGRASPIAVRVIELRSPTAFEAADFFSLYEREQPTLGADFVASESFVIPPGATQGYTRKAGAETRYVGVIAGFRDLERSIWRASATVAPPARVARGATRMQRVSVRLERSAVRLEVGPAG